MCSLNSGDVTVACCGVVARVHPGRSVDLSLVGLGQPSRKLDQRIKYRLQVERRAADDLEHICGSGLLFQRFGEVGCALVRSVVRWRSSLSSRVFSMAMTAWAAKFLTNAICLSVKGRTSWR